MTISTSLRANSSNIFIMNAHQKKHKTAVPVGCVSKYDMIVECCLGPRVQILHSAEEHNLSPFDLNIACLCQSIEINNNKYDMIKEC